ncbi:hypothetical protein B0J13DRAFT_21126 [Dactylonectria estremocensis]|uniref:Uncharacterized protein n=1 Tax=Dactylonectria estremocensis TaxID=1079267 RepID=A0A9P9FJV0_9HYPO|nr:hypothetical protein B0J13DRAFT_21126 [Dactylonectria estremocensis]
MSGVWLVDATLTGFPAAIAVHRPSVHTTHRPPSPSQPSIDPPWPSVLGSESRYLRCRGLKRVGFANGLITSVWTSGRVDEWMTGSRLAGQLDGANEGGRFAEKDSVTARQF